MLSKIIRIIITIAGGVLGFSCGVAILELAESASPVKDHQAVQALQVGVPVFFAVLLMVFFYACFPMLKRKSMWLTKKIEGDLQSRPFYDILGGTVGLICGLLIAFLISQLLIPLDFYYIGTALSIFAYIFFGYLGMSVGTKSFRKELDGATEGKKSLFGSMLKTKNLKQSNEIAMPKILDTSAIIDGRIADVLSTGFIEGKIIIPEFVLEELRHISDSADSMKRTRGRRGLDVLKEVQEKYGIEIYNTYDKSFISVPEVDVKLLKLAELMNGKVLTTDYNLIKVAGIQGIPVLNINELVRALRPVILPGESMVISIIKEGKENNQGVGYMDDGTMIVVEDGKRLIGVDVNVEVTSVLQTASGRMIFAKPTNHRH